MWRYVRECCGNEKVPNNTKPYNNTTVEIITTVENNTTVEEWYVRVCNSSWKGIKGDQNCNVESIWSSFSMTEETAHLMFWLHPYPSQISAESIIWCLAIFCSYQTSLELSSFIPWELIWSFTDTASHRWSDKYQVYLQLPPSVIFTLPRTETWEFDCVLIRM